MKPVRFKAIACAIQVILSASLVNSAIVPSHLLLRDFTNNSLSEDEGFEDYPGLLGSPNFGLVNPDVGKELISSFVVPSYLEKFLKSLPNVEDLRIRQEGELPEEILILFKGIIEENPTCVLHMIEYALKVGNITNEFTNENTWAIQMIDSWGKIPEGILSGHINVFGDFDECVGVKARDVEAKLVPGMSINFEGRYCTVYLADYNTAMPTTPIPVNKNARNAVIMAGESRKMGAVPVMEFLAMLTSGKGVQMAPSIGTCFPSTCSRNNIQQLLVNIAEVLYKNVSHTPAYPTQLLWPYTLACYVEEKPDFDAADISVMSLLAAFGGICLLTGAIDYLLNGGVENPPKRGLLYQYIMAFSAYSNIKAWASTKRVKGDMECVHGLRFFSTAWIILSHTYYAVTFLPQWNMVDVKRVHEDWVVLTVLNSTFAVDTFFVIGGMLVAFNIMKMLERGNGRINIITLYIKRYCRLTPTYAVLVGIMATLIPYLGNGPYWAVMNNWGKVCEDNWWTNLLYVNNLVNTSYLCQGETWYLANDMQFYILSPFIVFPLWKWEMIGAILLAIYTILSCIAPALVVHFLDISPTLIPTRDIGIGKSFTHLYIRPYARIAPYLVGIWLGWILYKKRGKKVKLPYILVAAFWIISTGTALTLVYAIHPWFDPEKGIPKAGALAYAGLSRFAFGIVVAWIIFACLKGYGGIVNSLLSWGPFIPLARLCYCVYLVSLHLQMILHVRFTQPIRYDPYIQTNFFLSHMVMSFLVGFVLWLLFESPFLILIKLIFDGGDNRGRPADNRQRPAKRFGIMYNDFDGDKQMRPTKRFGIMYNDFDTIVDDNFILKEKEK